MGGGRVFFERGVPHTAARAARAPVAAGLAELGRGGAPLHHVGAFDGQGNARGVRRALAVNAGLLPVAPRRPHRLVHRLAPAGRRRGGRVRRRLCEDGDGCGPRRRGGPRRIGRGSGLEPEVHAAAGRGAGGGSAVLGLRRGGVLCRDGLRGRAIVPRRREPQRGRRQPPRVCAVGRGFLARHRRATADGRIPARHLRRLGARRLRVVGLHRGGVEAAVLRRRRGVLDR
mmetsp:Transcript_95116/g.274970  ORF Transcript_95116/g.274970 Transcript_95116/m.274970 type:complete len:229 (+) Transcript_95116:95-781(+)